MVMMGIVSFLLICLFSASVWSNTLFDDSRFDNDGLEKSIFKIKDLSPVELAPFFADKKTQELLIKIKPYIVELSATEQGHSGSGVIIGWNAKNQPIILTAGHLMMYSQVDLAGVKGIGLDHPRGDLRGSIADEKTHVVLPMGYKEKPQTALGWYGLPIFHPTYYVDETVILRDLSLNFGYYLMTGRTVKLPIEGAANLDSMYSVKESLAEGFEKPAIGPVKIRSVLWESQVVVMGRAEYASEIKGPTGELSLQKKAQMSYSVGYVWSQSQMRRLSNKYRLDLSPKKHFVINGDFDKQMVGSGVFNQSGELVGVVVKLLRGERVINHESAGAIEHGRYLGAVALKIEHVFEQTQILTTQTELRDRVERFRTQAPVRYCSRFFAK